MTNKASLAPIDGPPQKRRRTHHNRKSPKPTLTPQIIVPVAETSTLASTNIPHPSSVSASSSSSFNHHQRRGTGEKKRSGNKKEDQRRREEAPNLQPATKTVGDRCSDYLSDEWKPEFRSTFPLAKALERRRVLVDYIHLVKRVSARKDKVETIQKRPSVLQPQTIEELEKEIDKCSHELDKLARKRDENSDLKKNLMSKYKTIYK